MRADFFESEVVIDVSGDQPVHLVRMAFTEHDLRALSVLLNAGAGAVGYGFTARTLSRHFIEAWRTTRELNG
jgi:hypothetical protein